MRRLGLLFAVLMLFNVLNVLLFFGVWNTWTWLVAITVFAAGASLLGHCALDLAGLPRFRPLVALAAAMAGAIGPGLCVPIAWRPGVIVAALIGLGIGLLVDRLDPSSERHVRISRKPGGPFAVEVASTSVDKLRMADTLEPERHRPQFTLMTLLMLPVLLAVGLGWLALPLNRARQNRRAAAVIEKTGGEPIYDRSLAHQPRPLWLRPLSSEPFVKPIGVNLSCRSPWDFQGEWIYGEGNRCGRVSDVDLAYLKDLDDLMDLQVLLIQGNPNLTDAGLANLKSLRNIETLVLGNANLSDAGLAHLQGLTSLRCLVFCFKAAISDAGLNRLTELTNLRFLYLRDTRVTDEGVQKLQKVLPACKIERTASEEASDRVNEALRELAVMGGNQ